MVPLDVFVAAASAARGHLACMPLRRHDVPARQHLQTDLGYCARGRRAALLLLTVLMLLFSAPAFAQRIVGADDVGPLMRRRNRLLSGAA
jgi:hypothetical protein